MGRGRAKAKQTKVARELKYHSPEINLERLRADISGEAGRSVHDSSDDLAFDDEDDDSDEDGESDSRAWSQ